MPELAAELVARLEGLRGATRGAAPRLVVLIDGRSGSGKTTLGAALERTWPVERLGPVQLVHLDDVYPGWHGLEAASRVVESTILDEVRPGWRRWDWALDREAEWSELDPAASVIVEGAGSLTRASSVRADLSIWLDLDTDTRRARALGRDGAAYEPWWQVWADQEARHIEQEAPRSLADLVVDVGHTVTPDVRG
ncbi:ATP-binding protein [Frigoribacterium sp. 2-23]|uniref:ATP-binding protein n=1 Tax=Frigoribacterium sp. 2-23 TaxID=3415006 RepID=UPI003C6FA5C6